MDSQEPVAIKQKIGAQLDKLKNLQADGDLTEVLADLSALLVSANYRDIRDVAAQMDLTELFHQFNTAPVEVLTHMMSVFNMFIEALAINEVFVKYYSSILEGLSSTNIVIVELWIKKIVKTVFTNEGLLKNVSNSQVNVGPLLRSVIQLLTSESTLVASSAHDICVSAAKAFRQEFFSPSIQDELRKVKEFDNPKKKVDVDTVKIRFSELCVDIACINQLMLEMMKVSGFLIEIVREFEEKISSDPLVAVNMIKIMTDLATPEHGLHYLKNETTVLPSVAARIDAINTDDIFGPLLLPGLINFFIRIAEFDLSILTEFPVVISKLNQFVENGSTDRDFLVLAIDSFAFVCHTSQGKEFCADRLDAVLDKIAWMVNSGNTEMKLRAIEALNEILEIHGGDPGNRACQLTEQWYTQLEGLDCGIARFLHIVREPFAELRVPALNFIRILATTPWGQKVLAGEADLLDYLLDRSTETTKEGREAKFEIVRELVMSPFIRLSFPPESLLRLRGYFNAGPIDKEDVNVAFENA